MKTKNLICGLLALTMLTGCAVTRSQAQEGPLNQALLLEKASQEQAEFALPERFTGDWTAQDGKVTIHADAEVAADLGCVLPTATVTPREFNQEDVDNLLRVFLKGEPLYGNVSTKQELKDWIDQINSPDWEPDPDVSEPKEERRARLNDAYAEQVLTAPDEKPIVHGFPSDANEPNMVVGSGTVDGVTYDIWINNGFDGAFRTAFVERQDYKYRDYDVPLPDVTKEEAIETGNALIQELGFDNMVLDDVQLRETGLWCLYYTPTVNGIPISSIRYEHYHTDGNRDFFGWRTYACSEESNPDKVSWYLENILLEVGKEGVLRLRWDSPSGATVIQEENTALMPFEKITSIADAMLPAVIIGPSEARSITEIDRINGFDTHFDAKITKVSLSLMRVRDKGSLQGTIVPVWDFWGTTDWYSLDEQPMEHGYDYECLMTLNAVDGSVVSRLFGY